MRKFLVMLACGALLLFPLPAASATQNITAPEVSNPEMKAIVDADQAERHNRPINWDVVTPADKKRREQTRALLAQGKLHTGQDFEEASLVFQHGDTADDYLLAHILAMVALAKGDRHAIWIASATLDRYLMKIGRKQVLGTQYSRPKDDKPWTQEPYDRELVSDALRRQLHVRTQAEQKKLLKEFEDGR